MTPEAQGAAERAAEVLAGILGDFDTVMNVKAEALALAEALAAANLLATQPTASHDETALRAGVEALAERWEYLANAGYIENHGLRFGERAKELRALLAARAAAGADLAGESGGTDG